MSRNYKAIYTSTNDSAGIEQAFYLKAETTKGVLSVPAATDFFYTLGGGSISYQQPFESSPHRSGRHHTDIIKKKKELSFSFSTYFNINESLGAAAAAEVDAPVRTLFKSLMGAEDVTAGAVYTTTTAPDFTFSLYEVGDRWARQARGCFVDGGNMKFPGNGEAMCEWSGTGAESYLVGIGSSTVANTGLNVTLQTGEGKRFPIGAQVMLIKNDGVTRSTDTATGASRKVVSVAGDVVTLNGAALLDADGSTLPIFLVYYEPAAKTAINQPVTGLYGNVSITGLGTTCPVRMVEISCKNDHEKVIYNYGTDALSGSYFVAAARFTADVKLEMNLGDKVLQFFNEVQSFATKDLTLILGDATKRHLQVYMPKIHFKVPAFTVPETGSIPITFDGNAFQTSLDAADELTVSFV